MITADTPPPGNVGYWYSFDRGQTWQKNFTEPGALLEESVGLGASGELYWEVALDETYPTVHVLRTPALTAPGPLSEIDMRSEVDQPYVHAFTHRVTIPPDKDRLYVGYIDHNGIDRAAAMVDVCLDARATAPTFTPVLLDFHRVPQDGYEVRPVAHSDGTVYVAYKSWSSYSKATETVIADIVVARDDNWGSGGFNSLQGTNPYAGKPVATNVRIFENQNLGGQRLDNDLSIAVDPTNSSMVYIVWGDNQGPNYTLRVRRSANRGQLWDDLIQVDSANLACLAINSDGRVGFMYQKLVAGWWETHFQRTTDGTGLNWDDIVLARTPVAGAVADYSRLISVGKDFYGAFPALNTPDPANFPATPPGASNPNGAKFLRQTTAAAPWRLLGSAGQVITETVDPFFFIVQDEASVAPPTGLSSTVR